MSTVQEDAMREHSRKMKDRGVDGATDIIFACLDFQDYPGNVSNVSNA